MKLPVDIAKGLSDEMAGNVAEFLGFQGDLKSQCAEQIKRLYQMFLKVDCLQLEVNPLAETPEGKIYTADAKLGFDDNAQFRYVPTFETFPSFVFWYTIYIIEEELEVLFVISR